MSPAAAALCEAAVRHLGVEGMAYRGIFYARSGRLDAAIEDFRAYIAAAPTGQDPLTPELLAALREAGTND